MCLESNKETCSYPPKNVPFQKRTIFVLIAAY